MSKQHSPLFARWRCLYHKCGSYNFTMLVKHEIEGICVIEKDVTVGVVKPKTWGGFKGNLSRHYLPEWTNIQKLKQSSAAIQTKWNNFLTKKRLEITKHRKNNVADQTKKILSH